MGGVERRSSLYCLLFGEDEADWLLAPVAQFPRGSSGGQGGWGACRGEGLVAGQHVPDRGCEVAGELDLGDFRAALFAEPLLGALVAVAVGGVFAGVGGRLDKRPAQVLGTGFGEWAAPVAVAGLVDAGAETAVADELGRRTRRKPGISGDGRRSRTVRTSGTTPSAPGVRGTAKRSVGTCGDRIGVMALGEATASFLGGPGGA